jgi:hypothetical protein
MLAFLTNRLNFGRGALQVHAWVNVRFALPDGLSQSFRFLYIVKRPIFWLCGQELSSP